MSEVIIALDFSSKEEVLNFLEPFKDPIMVKIGMELYYSEGPSIVKEIKEKGHKIFLDLKVHDIPNTAYKAMCALAKLHVDIVNVHCAGGFEMMKKAQEAFSNSNTLVIGVTQLTSISQEMLENELLIKDNLNDVVISYAKLAERAGLNGVVCSALESKIIHENINDNFKTICPGIRYGNANDDQVRICTPSDAKELGCDYIVVGRLITNAKNPFEMYKQVTKEFKGGQ
ncbi:MAG: orotidine-5'-phosphate decarboxylase [Anaerorhabdus sp.]